MQLAVYRAAAGVSCPCWSPAISYHRMGLQAGKTQVGKTLSKVAWPPTASEKIWP